MTVGVHTQVKLTRGGFIVAMTMNHDVLKLIKIGDLSDVGRRERRYMIDT